MDEKQASVIRSIAERVLGRFTSLRGAMRDRIREADRMAQREVMGAAQDVNTIYTAATTAISDLKSRLALVSRADSTGDRASAEAQLTSVEGYVKNMDERINELMGIAGQSAGFTLQIEQAAQQIHKLTTNAHMLAINARIEAARSSESSSKGFAVIAVEMKELSHSIGTTSETVKRLAQSLGSLLPNLDAGMFELRHQARTFSETLRGDIKSLADRAAAQRNDVADALESSDVTLSTIVKTSQSALSHLQFQDAMSQGLMRLDGTAKDAETAICKELGLEDRIARIESAMHVEIGGDKAVDQKNAGEVTLF